MRSSPLFPVLLAMTACGHAPVSPPPGAAPSPAADSMPAPPVTPDRCGIDLLRLLGDELSLRPRAGPADLYRLLHQAILGEEVGDPVPAHARLEAELAAAGPPRRSEPIVEDLDDRQGTVRVNLRRWRFIRASAVELWPIVEASARALGEGDRARLAACLDRAGPSLEALGADAAAFRAFAAERAGEGLPPVLHSEAYREAHAPAYRVVLRRFLPPWVTAPPPEAG